MFFYEGQKRSLASPSNPASFPDLSKVQEAPIIHGDFVPRTPRIWKTTDIEIHSFGVLPTQ